MRPTITTRPDLTRTRAAIAAYDELDAQIERCPTCDFEALLNGLDETKRAIGAAFALDTADRNDPEVARSWAAFNVERTREFVAVLTT